MKIAKRDGVEVEIFMEQEPGSAGVADIANYARLLAGFRFRKGVRNTGSKEVRAGPFSSAAEHGNVKLVKSGWNRDFLDEIETFPMGYHDDQVARTDRCLSDYLNRHRQCCGGSQSRCSAETTHGLPLRLLPGESGNVVLYIR